MLSPDKPTTPRVATDESLEGGVIFAADLLDDANRLLVIAIFCLLAWLWIRRQRGARDFSSEAWRTVLAPIMCGSFVWVVEEAIKYLRSTERFSHSERLILLVYFIANGIVAFCFFWAGSHLLTLKDRLHSLMRPPQNYGFTWLRVTKRILGNSYSVILMAVLAAASIVYPAWMLWNNSHIPEDDFARSRIFGIPYDELSIMASSVGMTVLGLGLLYEFTREKVELVSLISGGSLVLYGLAQLPLAFERSMLSERSIPSNSKYIILVATPLVFLILKVLFVVAVASLAVMLGQLERVQSEERRRWSEVNEGQDSTLRLMRRYSDDIHDHVLSQLGGIRMYSGTGQRLLGQRREEEGAEIFEKIGNAALDAEKRLRRVIAGMKPVLLPPGGLRQALRDRLDIIQSGLSISTFLRFDVSRELSSECQEALYSIATEALNNAERHSCAQRIEASVTEPFSSDEIGSQTALWLVIEDDGVGFQIDGQIGYGMETMRRRAEEVGGRFRVDSSPGAGTKVIVEIGRAFQ